MVSREGPIPLYYQIELRLREAIETGRYRPGDRLPPESELQREYNVSRVTVRTAIGRLEEDGLVTTHRGRGTFVTQQAGAAEQIERDPTRLLAFEEELLRQAGPPRVELLAVERSPLPSRMAALLGVLSGEETTRVRRVGWVGELPLWVESRYFHPEVAAALDEADLSSASVTALLETATGLHVDHSRLRISAGAAARAQAKHLQLNPGDPVLINEFAVYAEGRAVEAARAVFRADRYAFTVDLFASSGALTTTTANGSYSLIRHEVAAGTPMS